MRPLVASILLLLSTTAAFPAVVVPVAGASQAPLTMIEPSSERSGRLSVDPQNDQTFSIAVNNLGVGPPPLPTAVTIPPMSMTQIGRSSPSRVRCLSARRASACGSAR